VVGKNLVCTRPKLSTGITMGIEFVSRSPNFTKNVKFRPLPLGGADGGELYHRIFLTIRRLCTFPFQRSDSGVYSAVFTTKPDVRAVRECMGVCSVTLIKGSTPLIAPWSWNQRRIEPNSGRVVADAWDLVTDYGKEACKAANGLKGKGVGKLDKFGLEGVLGGYAETRGLGD